MKKLAGFACLLFTLSTIAVYAQSVDLNTGIRNAAAYFEQNLQSGSAIAVLSVRSDSLALSEYVIDELSYYLVNGRNFTVVDRNYMDAIQREMNYQLSGEVSDETAQSIGKRIGAQTVITGGVQPYGNEYRLDLRALSVETGVIQGVWRQDIADDNRMRSLTGMALTPSAAPRREPRTTTPRAGGSRFLVNVGAGGGYVFFADSPLFQVSASFDYLFPVGLSLGGYFAYLTYKGEYSINSAYHYFHRSTFGTMFALSAKAAWNFDLTQSIIPYLGLQFGYNMGNEDYTVEDSILGSSSNISDSYNLNSISIGSNFGIRFFFTGRIGAFIDLVYNFGPFTNVDPNQNLAASLGLALKF